MLVSGVESWLADAVKLLEPYLAAPTPGTTLALVAGPAMKKDHRLLKVIDGKRRLAFDVPGEKELPGHLRKEAQRIGARIDAEALRLLIDISGPDAVRRARRPNAPRNPRAPRLGRGIGQGARRAVRDQRRPPSPSTSRCCSAPA